MADRSVVYRFEGKFDNLKAGLTAAGSSVQDFGKKLTALDRQGAQMRAAFGTVGSAAGRMGIAAAGGLALVTKSAISWESAWAGVQKTVDGTTSQMAKLEGELRGLAKTLPATHTEIAAVAEAAGQLGIERGNIAAFTRTMIDLGETTNLSADEAATSLARFMNIMGTSQSEVSRLGSSLVGLGNSFATTESEILAMSMRLAGAGRQANLSESDVIGLAAAMSSVGIEAEAGGTAMSLTMKRIGKEVETSGEKLGLFAQVSGMSAEQFAAAWQHDAAGALTSFVTGLGNAEALGMSTNMVLSELGVTGIREADALLRLSGAAEMMGDAFRLSGEEASKNTALAIEAGKRYDTTASQMQVSWNNVKDAMIDFGEASLPVLNAGASALSGFANVAAGLPGPIKAISTSMLGVTAVLGGGLWFTSRAISGVADMREALQTLGVSSDKASRAMRGVRGAAMGFVAVNVAFAALDQLNKKLDETLPGLEGVTEGLIGLATAPEYASLAGLGREFDSLADSVTRVADGRWDDGLSSFFDNLLPGDTRAKSLREATAEIERLDQGLANLVGTGNAEMAKVALDRLTEAYGLSATQASQLRDLLPGYSEALKGQENAAKLAGDAAGGAAGAIGELGDEAGGATGEIKSLAEALNNLLSPTMEQDAATVAWRRSIQSLTEELEGGSNALDINTKRGQDNRDAIRDRVTALSGMIAADEAAGVEAEKLQRKMLRGAEAILQAGHAAGIAESDMRGYLRQLGLTPKQIRTLIENNAPEAKGKVDDLNNSLSRIPRNVQTTINVALSGLNSAMSSLGNLNPFRGMGSADGSTVPHGGPYVDRYPYLLAPGEEVISNRFGQADRFRPLLKAINAGRLADGGTVGLARGGTATRYTLDERREILRLEQSIRELTKSLNATGKEALNPGERAAATLDRLIARRDLRQARRAPLLEPLIERRDALRDRRADLRGGIGDLRSMRQDLLRPDGIVGETQQALQAFRRSIVDAGGTWTKRAQKMAADMMANARAIEANERAIETETANRDRLADSLAEHQASLDAVRQAMDQLSSQVASNFLSNPFNASISPVAAGGGSVGPSPELLAAQDALSAAKGRYHFALNDSSLGDIGRARAASAALAEMDQYQSQVDSLSRDLGGVGSAAEQAITGLAAFDQILAENTAAAKQFSETLTALAAAGLDGPLYEMLAASGDLGLALELLATGPAGIDARERAWAERDRITAELGAQVANEVHGAHFAEQLAAYEREAALLTAQDAKLATLVSQGAANDARRDALIQTQTDILANQIDRLQNAVLVQSRQLQNVSQQIAATKKGRG